MMELVISRQVNEFTPPLSSLPLFFSSSLSSIIMASPRLETFCCPNRDSATEFVVSFQSGFFSSICIFSSSLSFVLSVLQLLPKRRSSRRLSAHPHPKPAASSRILFIISLCDVLGCAGKHTCYSLMTSFFTVKAFQAHIRFVKEYGHHTWIFKIRLRCIKSVQQHSHTHV